MVRRLIAPSLLALALAACSKPAEQVADSNSMANSADTIATTGAPAGVGSYGPGLVATPVFVEQAAISDMYEIAASKLALTASKSAAIKDYATKMIAAHQATTAELKSLTANLDAKPPTEPDAKHARMLEDLQKAAPDKFDKLYLDQQTSAHREALGLMTSYATHGDNPGLKSFAEQTKPKIQDHLDMASMLDHDGADDTKKAS